MQRLQRFSTYSHLKQIVLKMIVDELASDEGATVSLNVSMDGGVSPNIVAGLQVIGIKSVGDRCPAGDCQKCEGQMSDLVDMLLSSL